MQKLLLKANEAAQIIGVGRTAFYEHIVTNKTFPKPVIIGKTKYYRIQDINNWVASLQAQASA